MCQDINIAYQTSILWGLKGCALFPNCPLLKKKKTKFDSVRVAFLFSNQNFWMDEKKKKKKKWCYLLMVLFYNFLRSQDRVFPEIRNRALKPYRNMCRDSRIRSDASLRIRLSLHGILLRETTVTDTEKTWRIEIKQRSLYVRGMTNTATKHSSSIRTNRGDRYHTAR